MRLKKIGAAIMIASAVFLAPRITFGLRINRPDVILDIRPPVNYIRQTDNYTIEIYGQTKVFNDRILDYKLASGTFGRMLVVLTENEIHRILPDGFVWVSRHRVKNPSCGFIAETGDNIVLVGRDRRIHIINLAGMHDSKEERIKHLHTFMHAFEKCGTAATGK